MAGDIEDIQDRTRMSKSGLGHGKKLWGSSGKYSWETSPNMILFISRERWDSLWAGDSG